MKRLLTLKAWKLVFAAVVIPFAFMFLIEVTSSFYFLWRTGVGAPLDGFSLTTLLVPVWLVWVLCLPFFWQYQVGTKLTRKLAERRSYFDRKFRFAFFVPLAILISLILIAIIQQTDKDGLSVSESRVQGVLIFFLLVTYLIGFFFRYRQMSQTLHWVDVASKRQPRGNAVNTLLTLFWWIGIWFLQPRVRAAWKGLQERSMEDHFIEK